MEMKTDMTIEELTEAGADVESGLVRCLDSEPFYLCLVGMALQDDGCAKLRQAIEEHRLNDAFEAAHARKGMPGNVSLTNQAEPVLEMTEALRHGGDRVPPDPSHVRTYPMEH